VNRQQALVDGFTSSATRLGTLVFRPGHHLRDMPRYPLRDEAPDVCAPAIIAPSSAVVVMTAGLASEVVSGPKKSSWGANIKLAYLPSFRPYTAPDLPATNHYDRMLALLPVLLSALAYFAEEETTHWRLPNVYYAGRNSRISTIRKLLGGLCTGSWRFEATPAYFQGI
jgi:hypothetical protein